MVFAATPKIINVPASAVIPTTTPPMPDKAMRSIAAAKIVKVVATSRRTPAPLDCPLKALTATPRITSEPANPAKAVPTCSMFKPDIMFKLAAMMARDAAIKGIAEETWLSFFSSGIVLLNITSSAITAPRAATPVAAFSTPRDPIWSTACANV